MKPTKKQKTLKRNNYLDFDSFSIDNNNQLNNNYTYDDIDLNSKLDSKSNSNPNSNSNSKFTSKLFSILNNKLTYIFILITILSIATFPIILAQSSSFTIYNLTTSNIDDNSLVISWNTNELATTKLKYGLTNNNLQYEYNDEILSIEHAVQILGLEPETTYYYEASSTNINGTTNKSETMNFTTANDNTPPTYSQIQTMPESQIIYGSTTNYQFSTDWEDQTEITNVTIHHNFTGNDIIEILNNTNQNTYTYQIQEISAGTYYWYTTATDKNGNTNLTPNQTYQIQKSSPALTLLINEEDENLHLEQYQTITIEYNSNNNQTKKTILYDGQTLYSANSTTNYTQYQLNDIGIHNITIISDESENYTEQQKTLLIEIIPPTINLFPTKTQYSINEQAGYTITGPKNSNITIEICGPIPPTGIGFVECYQQENIQNYTTPISRTHTYTKKTGEYLINAETIHANETYTNTTNYTVANTISIDIQGDTTIFEDEETELTAIATGGIPPYTYNWTLANGTKIQNQEIDIKYADDGTYTQKISVIDSQENSAEKTISIKVEIPYYLQITLIDEETNQTIEDAAIEINSKNWYTDTSGYVKITTTKGTHEITIKADDYKREIRDVTVNDDTTIEIKLTPLKSNEETEIEIISPVENEKTNIETTFKAKINTNTENTCEIYIKEEENTWSRLLKTQKITKNTEMTHTEILEPNKEFKWSIQCKSINKNTLSEEISFTTSSETTTQILNSDAVQDTGRIRTNIETALENLNSYDITQKQIAETLKIETTIKTALRDYERILRDINNIQFRTDLSDEDKQTKKDEYNQRLQKIIEETPLEIKVDHDEEIVKYPKKEEIIQVITEYAQAESKTGTIDNEFLQKLQNQMLTKTRISHVEITYISGETEKITLINKKITYESENSEEEPNEFVLIEYIPKELENNANNMVFLQDYTIVKQDPIIKFNHPDSISYYFKTYKDLDLSKETKTIAYSDSIYKKKRNLLTGNAILSNLDLASPAMLIILLILIIMSYLAYAYELPQKVSNKFKKNNEQKTIEKIKLLITEINEYLNNKDFQKANLTYKEIRLTYENADIEIKQKTYQAIQTILNNINVKYYEYLEETQIKQPNIQQQSKPEFQSNTQLDSQTNLNAYYEQLTQEEKELLQNYKTYSNK